MIQFELCIRQVVNIMSCNQKTSSAQNKKIFMGGCDLRGITESVLCSFVRSTLLINLPAIQEFLCCKNVLDLQYCIRYRNEKRIFILGFAIESILSKIDTKLSYNDSSF